MRECKDMHASGPEPSSLCTAPVHFALAPCSAGRLDAETAPALRPLPARPTSSVVATWQPRAADPPLDSDDEEEEEEESDSESRSGEGEEDEEDEEDSEEGEDSGEVRRKRTYSGESSKSEEDGSEESASSNSESEEKPRRSSKHSKRSNHSRRREESSSEEEEEEEEESTSEEPPRKRSKKHRSRGRREAESESEEDEMSVDYGSDDGSSEEMKLDRKANTVHALCFPPDPSHGTQHAARSTRHAVRLGR
jgi:hypothetical protein